MITLQHLYDLGGAMFVGFALLSLFDRTNRKRLGNALFYALLATSFLAGHLLGDRNNGILALAIAGVAGFGLLGRGEPPTTSTAEREAFADVFGNRLFLPALVIPATVFVGTLAYKLTPLGQAGLFEPAWVTPILLGLGALLALLVIVVWRRPPALAPLNEGRRLMDAIGWAVVLPQMLAALGAVFLLAGVGNILGGIFGQIIPDGSLFIAIVVYALGMAAFTMITGNAFAAFPVMVAAIGVPVLINSYHGNPAVIGAIGMLAGFCGTLMTPMAANFNIVPVRLLELRDQNAVIKAQLGTALPLLLANVLLIYFLAF
ncbi:MAG: hypothetical protein QOD42_98 [Sphingomonadales bacterium]|jgi:uncharacterized membrane protein|nr:hypothetical protein [Sphingomonadales bacterium]